MFEYKGYQVDPYTGQIFTKTGKLKQSTKCGRKNEYLKVSIGRNSSATVQRVVVCAYYGIVSLKGYYVHHIDQNTQNNTISNLLVVDDITHHELHHLSSSDYIVCCHELKKSERSRLKEWRLLK